MEKDSADPERSILLAYLFPMLEKKNVSEFDPLGSSIKSAVHDIGGINII